MSGVLRRRPPDSRSSPHTRAALLVIGLGLAGLAACGDDRSDSAPAPAANANPCGRAPAFAGSRLLTLRRDGTSRRYWLHLPPAARDRQPLALVLGLHGTGGKAGFFERQSRLSRVADRAGFVAAYPYALGRPSRWTLPGMDGPDDIAFARALIDAIRTRACVDPRRVSAFGHSNGGGFAVALACDPRVGLAAAVSVSGGYGAQQRCATDPPPPLLELHGDRDPIVPYAGARAFVATWARWAGCDGRPTVTAEPDGSRRETFAGCDRGAALIHVRRHGAGHDLPPSAAQAAASFVAQRRRP